MKPRTLALSLGLLAPHVCRADRIDDCTAAYEQAQELKLGHKLRDALAQLDVCSRATCPIAVRKDCKGWIVDVSRAMPSVVVKVRGASNPTATLDGAPIPVDGSPIEVDPGVHHVAASDPATQQSVTSDVTITEGEKRKSVELDIPKPIAPPEPPPKKPGPPWYTWVIGGVGVAGVVSCAAWGTAALVYEQELRSSCYPSCSSVEVDRVHNRALIADISLAVGIVGLGVAAVLFFWPRSAPARAAGTLARGWTF